MKETNITMIGGPETGKTCYLYAMADQMTFGVHGFRFNAKDYNIACSLDDCWSMILNDGKWPKQTNENQRIEFECRYGTKMLASFNWFDYRGGLATEGKLDSSNPVMKEFMEILNRSTCLLILVSAEDIKGILNGHKKPESLFKRYKHLMDMYIQEHDPIPIAFVITKGDLLDEGEFERGVELLKSTYYQEYFITDPCGDGWLITFVVVGLGAEKLGKTRDGMVTGKIAPFNVHLPVLFAVRCSLVNELMEAQAEVNGLLKAQADKKRVLEKENSRSFLSRVWNGDIRDDLNKELESINKSLVAEKKNFDMRSADLFKLTEELMKSNTAVVYCNGHQMTIREA